MSTAHPQLASLLTRVRAVAAHQAEIRRLKGEDFNLFTILGMETAENKTHSAFLGALLDPKGAHGHGTAFLQAFLETVGYKGEFQVAKAWVALEHYIGPRDDSAKTGGRIDLYLSDGTHSIAIENKIYAGDQFAQLERYAQHNKSGNAVYYLTLHGHEASPESRGNLQARQDYHPIAYRDHILRWLTACMRLASDQPILRESIKQYILLIQKLTGQLSDTQMRQEIHDLIAADYQAAKLIQQSVEQVELDRIRGFMHKVKDEITAMLQHDSSWSVHIDADIFAQDAGIRIYNTAWGDIQVSLIGWRRVASAPTKYGLNAWQEWWDRADVLHRMSEVAKGLDGFQSNPWFPYFKLLLFFNTAEHRAQLFDAELAKSWVQAVAREVADFALRCQAPLAGIQRIPGS